LFQYKRALAAKTICAAKKEKELIGIVASKNKNSKKKSTGKNVNLNNKNNNRNNLTDSVEFADENLADFNKKRKNKVNRNKGDGC
jgi:hypothetical protein